MLKHFHKIRYIGSICDVIYFYLEKTITKLNIYNTANLKTTIIRRTIKDNEKQYIDDELLPNRKEIKVYKMLVYGYITTIHRHKRCKEESKKLLRTQTMHRREIERYVYIYEYIYYI